MSSSPVEAKGELKRTSKSKLHHIEIHPRKGGHLVRHVMESDGSSYHDPKEHIFGKGDGAKLMAHLKTHAKIESGESTPDAENKQEDALEGE